MDYFTCVFTRYILNLNCLKFFSSALRALDEEEAKRQEAKTTSEASSLASGSGKLVIDTSIGDDSPPAELTKFTAVKQTGIFFI